MIVLSILALLLVNILLVAWLMVLDTELEKYKRGTELKPTQTKNETKR